MGAATNIARIHCSRNIMIEYASYEYGRAWLGGMVPYQILVELLLP